jgi:hypothetical protein
MGRSSFTPPTLTVTLSPYLILTLAPPLTLTLNLTLTQTPTPTLTLGANSRVHEQPLVVLSVSGHFKDEPRHQVHFLSRFTLTCPLYCLVFVSCLVMVFVVLTLVFCNVIHVFDLSAVLCCLVSCFYVFIIALVFCNRTFMCSFCLILF